MTDLASRFVDPTIPGLSGRDLLRRAGSLLLQAARGQAALRRDLQIRQDLAHLDRNLLRDLGLDRSRT